MASPYQPSLLRLLHGTTALAVLGSWLSGLIIYSHHDGRWGRLPLSFPGEWIDLHGTVGVVLLPLAVLLAAYALTLGRRVLQRPTNAVTLLALVLAIASGKLMQEDWLRDGELHHLVYSLHLLGWLLLTMAVVAHLAGLLRRGGPPLAVSMLSLRLHRNDTPGDWGRQIGRFFRPRA